MRLLGAGLRLERELGGLGSEVSQVPKGTWATQLQWLNLQNPATWATRHLGHPFSVVGLLHPGTKGTRP